MKTWSSASRQRGNCSDAGAGSAHHCTPARQRASNSAVGTQRRADFKDAKSQSNVDDFLRQAVDAQRRAA